MKKIFLIGLLVIVAFGSCRKFLNVEPLDSLSGNNFWKTRQDVEAYTNDVYRLFRDGFAMRTSIIMMGDLRCAPVRYSNGLFPARQDFNFLAANDLKKLIAAKADRSLPGYDPYTEWWQRNSRWDLISDWQPVYKVIQAANILNEKVADVAKIDNSMSDGMVKKYKAEAVFMRCLSYFFLIRIFGDVPYYTNAYNEVPLPRTSHLEVAKKCIAELEAIKEALPWTYEDPALRTVRAMRGSVLALEMHLNMWLAGFDMENKTSYYQEVDRLGNELTDIGETQMGAYRLYPLSQLNVVFGGRSQEGLFEIAQNINYGETSASRRMTYAACVLYNSLLAPGEKNTSELAYYTDYLKQLYPEDVPDGRIKAWFDANMYKEDGTAQIFKFYNIAMGDQGGAAALSNNYFIFRYPDALLLHAEALAELGEKDRAKDLLNRIRLRAEAPEYIPAGTDSDQDLKDAIFWERCKELMGEGHYYYDLVRTRKVYNPDYCYNPITYGSFVQGAWMWPINEKALRNNPYMTLNTYWR